MISTHPKAPSAETAPAEDLNPGLGWLYYGIARLVRPRQAVVIGFGLDNVQHHLHTTQEFVTTAESGSLTDIGLLFIDGYHSAEQARFDYRAFADCLAPRAWSSFTTA